MIWFSPMVLIFSGLLSDDDFRVTRLREYEGVDPHFDNIARQYHDIVKAHGIDHLVIPTRDCTFTA